MKDNLNFYRQGDAFGEFSNFWYAPITLGGVEWPTTEHYFQAQKFALADDLKYVEMVRMAPTAGDAAKMGRNRNWPLRADWEEAKDDIMRDCVRQKFFQHPDLAKVLRSTGEKYLVEHTRNDRYWADGGDGKGKNMLGLILMEVREALASMTEDEIAKKVEQARGLLDV